MFAKNVGTIDKLMRYFLGVALIFGALNGYGTWMWIGLLPLLTGMFGTCPLYSVLGVRTCKAES
ncbi:Protein of unknown function (DUF2892) [Shimia isoporae]|uniref:Inner membrane protein YgaP-like transmembrane domain-containing protein n=1 Tax=Shimia isoporae TaxID=647720 RepID=A0A4R1NM53_9RHOB|nr:DUF2892 domain-containing protein [Shimia isoporae]TCL09215.1 Protein of unknown function (DUF2892) [Shimia isoporae]